MFKLVLGSHKRRGIQSKSEKMVWRRSFISAHRELLCYLATRLLLRKFNNGCTELHRKSGGGNSKNSVRWHRHQLASERIAPRWSNHSLFSCSHSPAEAASGAESLVRKRNTFAKGETREREKRSCGCAHCRSGVHLRTDSK